MAARCTAAEATLLRQIREQKLYLDYAKDWEEFCTKHLKTNKQNANRLIRILEEFGPAYFEVAQFARISPATYRAIAPAVHDQALHHNGEAIALIPENAEKVAAAVADLRKTAPPPAPEAAPSDPIPPLDKSCDDLVAQFENVIPQREHRERIRASLGYLQSRLDRVSLML
jgi:hypothetical protein